MYFRVIIEKKENYGWQDAIKKVSQSAHDARIKGTFKMEEF